MKKNQIKYEHYALKKKFVYRDNHKNLIYKYNHYKKRLNYVYLYKYIYANTTYLQMNLYIFVQLHKKPFFNALQFFSYNELQKPKFITLSPANKRFKKLNIYSKFLSIIMRRGLKKKIINVHSQLFRV